MGSVNNDDLHALQEKFLALERDLDAFYERAAKELAARLLAKVIPRTPVGDYQKDNLPEVYKRGNKKKGIKAGDVKRDKNGNIKRSKYKQVSFTTKKGENVSFKALSVKMGGTLRRGWTANTHEEAVSGVEKEAEAYAQSLQVNKRGDFYEITIENPVHYAAYVEYGHRTRRRNTTGKRSIRKSRGWVEGKFMLRMSESEIRALQPQILERMLKVMIEEASLE